MSDYDHIKFKKKKIFFHKSKKKKVMDKLTNISFLHRFKIKIIS